MSFVVLKATSPTSKTYVLLISEENKEKNIMNYRKVIANVE